MSHSPFLPEDAWKQEAVNRGLAEHRRVLATQQQQKIQEGVRRLIESKESKQK